MSRHLRQAAIAAVVIAVVFSLTAAYSHILLPASVDPCQRDATHKDHVSELPAFHCIGHSEADQHSGEWDHIHPWMEEPTTELIHGAEIVYEFLLDAESNVVRRPIRI